jgi:hypothetical protein
VEINNMAMSEEEDFKPIPRDWYHQFPWCGINLSLAGTMAMVTAMLRWQHHWISYGLWSPTLLSDVSNSKQILVPLGKQPWSSGAWRMVKIHHQLFLNSIVALLDNQSTDSAPISHPMYKEVWANAPFYMTYANITQAQTSSFHLQFGCCVCMCVCVCVCVCAQWTVLDK